MRENDLILTVKDPNWKFLPNKINLSKVDGQKMIHLKLIHFERQKYKIGRSKIDRSVMEKMADNYSIFTVKLPLGTFFDVGDILKILVT